ncbi:MAG: hypothetical protein IVW36_00805 [Dehalococcoidia bacterium]|nr:hypothetical protein [Dehalococcoidia bacterium]
MNARDLFPECPTHGGRIVSIYEVESAVERGGGRAVFPHDLDRLLGGQHDRAVVSDGHVRCNECGAPADMLHFLPNIISVACIQASCSEHDFGGYGIPLDTRDGLTKEPFRWLHHLSSKMHSEATMLTLATWLGYDGAVALDRMRAA